MCLYKIEYHRSKWIPPGNINCNPWHIDSQKLQTVRTAHELMRAHVIRSLLDPLWSVVAERSSESDSGSSVVGM